MPTASLKFAAPRSAEAHALNDMLDHRAELASAARDAENAPHVAAQETQRASAELAALERRRHNGDDVPEAELKAAEKALATARAKTGQPWTERAQGARAALRDADVEIGAYVRDNYDPLNGELSADAEAVKSRVDDALAEVVAAHAAREHVASRANALASVIRPVRPGDVAWSKVEGVTREAEAVLLGGGEAAPATRHDPRVPRAGKAVGDFEPVESWS